MRIACCSFVKLGQKAAAAIYSFTAPVSEDT